MQTLLPCPFCGGNARCVKTNAYENEKQEEWMVRCNDCSCAKGMACCGWIDMTEYGEYSTQEEAILAWNKRA